MRGIQRTRSHHNVGRLVSRLLSMFLVGWLALSAPLLPVQAEDPLPADPAEISWFTFSGGAFRDTATDVVLAADGSGTVFMVGDSAAEWGTPVSAFSGSTAGFAAAYASDGSLLWNTFLSAAGETAECMATSAAYVPTGHLAVIGWCSTTWGTPVRPFSGGKDVFVAQLNLNGSLEWLTFLGSVADDNAGGVTADDNGAIYVTGFSEAVWGSAAETISSSSAAFVAKLNGAGLLQWNTFLGGEAVSSGSAIGRDEWGNLYVAGLSEDSWGSPLRAYSADDDVFAVKLSPTGSLQWLTFVGGLGKEMLTGAVSDAAGNFYLAGGSQASWGSPVEAYAGTGDIFAARLAPQGELVWNTFLGSAEADDYAFDIAIDLSGNLYLAGFSFLPWGNPWHAWEGPLPVVMPDAFAARLSPDGDLDWNMFAGSSLPNLLATGVAVDGRGSVYVSGYGADDWPGALNPLAGNDDAFLMKIGVPLAAVRCGGQLIPSGLSRGSLALGTDFGWQPVGSVMRRTFTLTNEGEMTLSFANDPAVTITGANAAEFIVDMDWGTTVAPGESAEFTLTFQPAGMGLRQASVFIETNSASSPFHFAVEGGGQYRVYLPQVSTP